MSENDNKPRETTNECNCEDETVNEQKVSDGSQTTIGIIFQRIVTDEEFKQLLLKDANAALAEYELSETQAVLIKSLSEEDFNKLTPENLDEFFAADAAVYTPDEADLMDFEAYDPDDFEEIE